MSAECYREGGALVERVENRVRTVRTRLAKPAARNCALSSESHHEGGRERELHDRDVTRGIEVDGLVVIDRGTRVWFIEVERSRNAAAGRQGRCLRGDKALAQALSVT